jgi:FAD dependent oxidoreductase TIGR03364
MNDKNFDDVIVGAGIAGLALAESLAKRGRKVLVVEKDTSPQGASIRNFGMIWPIGQPAGPALQQALRAREIWLELLAVTGIWHDAESGSLHLAFADDEAAVLREFAAAAPDLGYHVQWLDPADVRTWSPRVQPENLRGGLWSGTEIAVDPRQVAALLPRWLERVRKVHFLWGIPVTDCSPPAIRSGTEILASCDRAWICPGVDLLPLAGIAAQEARFTRCKLQMMRTSPLPRAERIGPMLAGGLTLRHYPSFGICPSLEHLRGRLARDFPQYEQLGIHVMVSQTQEGELTIGDSHEYDAAISPFDSAEIERLILDYLARMFDLADAPIASRWSGQYLKMLEGAELVRELAPRAVLLTGLGGAGMTRAFAVAEDLVARVLDQGMLA